MKFDKPNTGDPKLDKLFKQVHIKLNALLRYKTFKTEGSKRALKAFELAVKKANDYV